MQGRARQIALRLGFLALLLGGLVLWSERRRPRDLPLEIDLTGALPGDITGLDVVLTRGGGLLLREQPAFGAAGAPAVYRLTARARPGPAEVDVTLVYAQGAAHRTRTPVELGEAGARISVR